MYLVLILAFLSFSASANHQLILETGAVWQYRNDVRINPDSGDTLEFDKFAKNNSTLHYRLEYHYKFSKSHALRFIYAPYHVEVTGKENKNIRFKDEIFTKGEKIDVNYMFNSYRLGYKYIFNNNLNLGITLKIREARITLKQGNKSESYDNVGVVPLIYISYMKSFSKNWSFYSDADFAAAPQGRAIDLTAKLKRLITNNSDVGFGLRSLEGGAENDKVYTFSWLNYLVVDYRIKF